MKIKITKMFTFIILVSLIAGCEKTELERKQQQEQTEKEGGDGAARVYAERVVREHLKWPDNAEFDWRTKSAKQSSSDSQTIWIAKGKVSAKNSFGAMLTHVWIVKFRWNVESQTWDWLECAIGNEMYMNTELAVEKAAEVEEKEREIAAQRKENARRAKRQKAEREREDQKLREELLYRTWTSGKHTVEARLSVTDGTHVWLKRRDGKTIKVPISKLSPADVEHLENRKLAREKR